MLVSLTKTQHANGSSRPTLRAGYLIITKKKQKPLGKFRLVANTGEVGWEGSNPSVPFPSSCCSCVPLLLPAPPQYIGDGHDFLVTPHMQGGTFSHYHRGKTLGFFKNIYTWLS